MQGFDWLRRCRPEKTTRTDTFGRVFPLQYRFDLSAHLACGAVPSALADVGAHTLEPLLTIGADFPQSVCTSADECAGRVGGRHAFAAQREDVVYWGAEDRFFGGQ